MKQQTLRMLARIRTYRKERRQRTMQGYADYMDFWRAYYDR